jgi:hypothetical protein
VRWKKVVKRFERQLDLLVDGQPPVLEKEPFEEVEEFSPTPL